MYMRNVLVLSVGHQLIMDKLQSTSFLASIGLEEHWEETKQEMVRGVQ